jgi:acetoacetate decarboxylase
MVLQGEEEGFAPPFDSSMYGASFSPSTPGTEYAIEYDDCDALAAFFTLEDESSEQARALLPEGVEPFSEPMQGGVLVARYPFSTVGEYNEFIALLQVEDTNGEMAYYIPYIYVTNDAAMAAGRELAGAPKKMADIEFEREGSVYEATMERPTGKRLLSLTATPEQRATGGMVDALLPSPTPLLSVRHLPPVEGGDGLTQLVEWYADFEFEEDKEGRKMWNGPASVAYESHSAQDPVHKLQPDSVLMGAYSEFSMELGVTEVQKEWDL